MSSREVVEYEPSDESDKRFMDKDTIDLEENNLIDLEGVPP